MKFNCENLEVYKISRLLIIEIYKLTKIFPPDERFGLTSQLRRAVISTSLNIAEGSGKISKKDFANFIRIAIGSLIETDTALKISIDLNYIKIEEYNKLDNQIKELYFKLIALDKSLRKTK
ncbi:MAG: four helix bundle protein [Candidatus Moraniibacteriota bacterium]